MAFETGQGSTLNGNAPVFTPNGGAAYSDKVVDGAQRSDLIGSSKSSESGCELYFYPPQKSNGNSETKFALIPRGVFSLGAEKWYFSLVGKLWGGKLLWARAVSNIVNKLWGKHGKIEVSEGENGFYIFRFPNEESMSFALKGQPWHICGFALTLQQWVPNSQDMENSADASTIPVWITLTRLPVELMTQGSLSRIASLIGNPLCMDRATATHSRVSSARVCVEVELNAEIPESVRVKVDGGTFMDIGVSCLMKAVRCAQYYNVIGHTVDECGRKAHAAENPELKGKRITGIINEAKLSHGPPSRDDKGKGIKIDPFSSFERKEIPFSFGCGLSCIEEKGVSAAELQTSVNSEFITNMFWQKEIEDEINQQRFLNSRDGKGKGIKTDPFYSLEQEEDIGIRFGSFPFSFGFDLSCIEEKDVYYSAADYHTLDSMEINAQIGAESLLHGTDKDAVNYRRPAAEQKKYALVMGHSTYI